MAIKKVFGYMILVYDPDIEQYKPINFLRHGYDPWFYSETSRNMCMVRLNSIEMTKGAGLGAKYIPLEYKAVTVSGY